MASHQRHFRPNGYNAETFNAMLKAKINRRSSQINSLRKVRQISPKYQKVRSESRFSRVASAHENKQDYQIKTRKVYHRLFNELKEIKQTLKQSLVNVSQAKKKKSVKRREKVITQISEPDEVAGRKHSPHKKASNYYDVLRHIEEIKNREKVKTSQKSGDQHRSLEQQKTLFYGIDYIDNIEFKVKIKLSRSSYFLFAKNSNTKIMVEMSYVQYMKLNLSQLKANPCNILPLLKIQNNKVVFKLKTPSDRKKYQSFKSFLSYY